MCIYCIIISLYSIYNIVLYSIYNYIVYTINYNVYKQQITTYSTLSYSLKNKKIHRAKLKLIMSAKVKGHLIYYSMLIEKCIENHYIVTK